MDTTRGRSYARDDQGYGIRGPSLPRSVRPQRSLANISNRSSVPLERNIIPPTPRSYIQRRNQFSNDVTVADRNSRMSLSSASSQGSSMFSAQDQSYESSTSVEEALVKPGRDWGGVQRRQRPARPSLDDDTPAQGALESSAEGYGASLWNRVASAANSLTINVSKAWANGVFTYEGEVTPPGGESRLTLALKNYHLSKAKTIGDLPSWLFSEEERRVRRDITSSRGEQSVERATDIRPTRERGLKSIYADAISDPSRMGNTGRYADDGGSRRDVYSRSSGSPVRQTKATTRLEAMRNARTPSNPSARENPGGGMRVDGPIDNIGDGNRYTVIQGEAPRRIGLPRGPKLR